MPGWYIGWLVRVLEGQGNWKGDRNTLLDILDLVVWLKSLVGWSQDWMETELQSGLKSSSGSLWCNKAISLLQGAGQ